MLKKVVPFVPLIATIITFIVAATTAISYLVGLFYFQTLVDAFRIDTTVLRVDNYEVFVNGGYGLFIMGFKPITISIILVCLIPLFMKGLCAIAVFLYKKWIKKEVGSNQVKSNNQLDCSDIPYIPLIIGIAALMLGMSSIMNLISGASDKAIA